MARSKKRERGVRGRPWYRKFNDTWYIDHDGKQLPVKDWDGNNIKGADNREQAEQCWVLMQARMFAPQTAEENTIRLIFSMYLDHVVKNRPDAFPAYRRTLVGFADSLPVREFRMADLTATEVDRWLEEHPDWSNTTKATYLTIVQAALNWAAEPH